MTKQKVLAAGGSTLVSLGPERWGTKLAFRDYLADLSQDLPRLEYIAPRSPWPFECAQIPVSIPVHPIGRSRISGIRFGFAMLRRSEVGCTFLLHYPTCLRLYPFWRWIRRRTGRIVCYISNDYQKDAAALDSKWRQHHYIRAYEQAIRTSDAVIMRGRMLAEQARLLNRNVYETVPVAALDQVGLRPTFQSQESSSPDRFNVLFMGRLMKRKGVQNLIDATAQIHSAGHRIQLHIVGDGPDADAFASRIQQFGLGSICHMHGYLSDPLRLAAVWSEADALVMPSTHPEGVPRVIEEAFAWGVPVVSTNVGGIAAEFGNGEVLLVEPGDQVALVNALLQLKSRADLRDRLRVLGLQRIDRWRRSGSAGAQHARILMGTEPAQ